MSNPFARLICLFLMLSITTQAADHLPYEMPSTQVVPIKDHQTGRNYALCVKLPDGYHDNDNRLYPTLYYTDAAWHIQALSAAPEYLMQEVILVGISWQTDADESLLASVGQHVSRFRLYHSTFGKA